MYSGSIGNNKRRSNEAFHFWTIKRRLVIKSTRSHVGQVIGYTDRIHVRGKFPGRSIVLFFFFFFVRNFAATKFVSFEFVANFQKFFATFLFQKRERERKHKEANCLKKEGKRNVKQLESIRSFFFRRQERN